MTTPKPELEYVRLLNATEVGTLFRVGYRQVTRWADAGKLTTIRTPGGHRRYIEAEIHALLERKTKP